MMSILQKPPWSYRTDFFSNEAEDVTTRPEQSNFTKPFFILFEVEICSPANRELYKPKVPLKFLLVHENLISVLSLVKSTVKNSL